MRNVTEGTAILIPLGMVARTRVMARLLLRHWMTPDDQIQRVIRSPVDAIDDDPESIPPMLQPLFLETLEPDAFWDGLLKLDRSIELEPPYEGDVRELVHLGLVFFLSHEFTHALHGHLDLLDRARAGQVTMPIERIRRGIEIDADDGAAAISMLAMQRDIQQAVAAGQDDVSVARGWLRLTYVVTMLFAITDTVRKHFPGYQSGAYNHPMVRCELFFVSVGRALHDSPKQVLTDWRDVSTQGWLKCLQALELLNVEAMSGKFGALPAGRCFAPLHAMNYGVSPFGVSNRALWDLVQEAHTLLAEVRSLLPLFQT
jgi:hypothetical protein